MLHRFTQRTGIPIQHGSVRRTEILTAIRTRHLLEDRVLASVSRSYLVRQCSAERSYIALSLIPSLSYQVSNKTMTLSHSSTLDPLTVLPDVSEYFWLPSHPSLFLWISDSDDFLLLIWTSISNDFLLLFWTSDSNNCLLLIWTRARSVSPLLYLYIGGSDTRRTSKSICRAPGNVYWGLLLAIIGGLSERCN